MKTSLRLLPLLPFLLAAWIGRAAAPYVKHQYRIPMRDGVKLYTAVYTPEDDSEAHPVLITRTPYGCGPCDGRFAPVMEQRHMRMYRDEGYILVFQDVRGRNESEGVYENIRPPYSLSDPGACDEATDAYDTVEWLLAHLDGHNGCVGFIGCSYPGFYAMMAGLSGHPAVRAVSPQAPVTDWFMGDDTRHNGAFMLTDAFHFIPGMCRADPKAEAKIPSARELMGGASEYDYLLGVGTVDSLTRLLGPDAGFWREMAVHPDYDAWWQARDVRRYLREIRPAVLVTGGLFDAEDLYGTWETYKTIRRCSPATECMLAMGPWKHGEWTKWHESLGRFEFGTAPSEEYYREVELPFFNHYLKGEDDVPPPVSVYVTGENAWHRYDAWPPRNAEPLTLYLAAEGGLTTRRPAAKRACSTYRSDPAAPVPHNAGGRRDKGYMFADQRFAAGREDVLCFATGPLSDSVVLAGAVQAALCVSISTTDADFIVKVIDCHPDGYQQMIRAEVMRGRYRRSFAAPQPFIPGRIDDVRFALPDIAHCFLPGHRIMVQIQSSWFPLVDRNPQQFVDIYRCGAGKFVPCDVSIHHRRDAASHLRFERLK